MCSHGSVIGIYYSYCNISRVLMEFIGKSSLHTGMCRGRGGWTTIKIQKTRTNNWILGQSLSEQIKSGQ